MSENGRNAACDLAGYESFAAARTLVVEQDTVAGEELMAFAINARHPVGINLCYSVGAARLKRSGFALRGRRGAKHFRARSLVKSSFAAAAANRLKKACGSRASNIAGVFRHIETDTHVALRSEMVNLVGSVTIDQIQEPLAAGEVPVMKEELGSRLIGIFVDVVNSLSMKSAGATDNAVYFVTPGERGKSRPGPRASLVLCRKRV